MPPPVAEPRSDAAVRPTPAAVAPPAFSVSVTSNQLELCGGECAELTVQARNATGDVRYAWSDGLPAGSTQRVCPATTHTYRVDATASAASGEFTSERMASSGVTVAVRDCSAPKADDGVLCELRHRFEYPATGDVFKATKPWVNLGTISGSGAVRATPDGGAWIVGSFAQELDLGARAVRADAPMSTFVHKLDKDCKPVLTRVLSATTVGDTILPSGLAVDAQGNAYVATVAGPLFEFNLFSPQPLRWTSELLIDKLAPDGSPLYRYRIPTGPGAFVSDVEVNAAGELFVAGMVPENSDLGGGLIGIAFTTMRTFALKVGADGRFAAQSLNTGSYQLALAGDQALQVVQGTTSFDVLSGLLFGSPSPGPARFGVSGLAQLDLRERWHTPFDPAQGNATAGEGTSLGLALLIEQDVWVDDVRTRRTNALRRYAMDGTIQRETVFIDRTIENKSPDVDAGLEELFAYIQDSFYFSYVRESEPGTVVMAGGFAKSQELAGVALTLEPQDSGALVLKLDAEDRIRWVRQQKWGLYTQLGGMGSSPNGEVVVAGQARVRDAPNDGEDLEYDLVVRRLRAN